MMQKTFIMKSFFNPIDLELGIIYYLADIRTPHLTKYIIDNKKEIENTVNGYLEEYIPQIKLFGKFKLEIITFYPQRYKAFRELIGFDWSIYELYKAITRLTYNWYVPMFVYKCPNICNAYFANTELISDYESNQTEGFIETLVMDNCQLGFFTDYSGISSFLGHQVVRSFLTKSGIEPKDYVKFDIESDDIEELKYKVNELMWKGEANLKKLSDVTVPLPEDTLCDFYGKNIKGRKGDISQNHNCLSLIGDEIDGDRILSHRDLYKGIKSKMESWTFDENYVPSKDEENFKENYYAAHDSYTNRSFCVLPIGINRDSKKINILDIKDFDAQAVLNYVSQIKTGNDETDSKILDFWKNLILQYNKLRHLSYHKDETCFKAAPQANTKEFSKKFVCNLIGYLCKANIYKLSNIEISKMLGEGDERDNCGIKYMEKSLNEYDKNVKNIVKNVFDKSFK